jgi:hypothetical protein
MKILKLDILKFSDYVIDLVEYCSFQGMHQAYRLENKEAIKNCLKDKIKELKNEYEIVELELPKE